MAITGVPQALASQSMIPKPSRVEGETKSLDDFRYLNKSCLFSRKFLNDIIESRVDEILNAVDKSLKKISRAEPLPAGIVLTGGGAKMPGIVEFSKQKFKLPGRLAEFSRVKGLDETQFSTALGLLLLGFDAAQGEGPSSSGGGSYKRLKRIFKVFLP